MGGIYINFQKSTRIDKTLSNVPKSSLLPDLGVPSAPFYVPYACTVLDPPKDKRCGIFPLFSGYVLGYISRFNHALNIT